MKPYGVGEEGDSHAWTATCVSHPSSGCVRANALQVGSADAARGAMVNSQEASCGWHARIPSDGTGIVEVVARMLSVPGYS